MNSDVHSLVEIDRSDLVLADPDEDLRDHTVLDRGGREVGTVDGLLVDEQDRRVRFLQVGSGGFLGLGKERCLIPTNAITSVDADVVSVDTLREQVAAGPTWDPDLEEAPVEDYYAYYGVPAYWAVGYVDPRLSPRSEHAEAQDDAEPDIEGASSYGRDGKKHTER